MNNCEEILVAIKTIIIEMFEIAEEAITLEVRLYEDLDFDSIDAVDRPVRLKEMVVETVKSEDFMAVLSLKCSKQFITCCLIHDRRRVKAMHVSGESLHAHNKKTL